MNITLEALRKYKLQADDETFGQVTDLLIEEGNWTGRWLVVDTGDWLPGKKVLLSPVALGKPDPENRVLPVHQTREEIESAPHLDEHAPVSREYEQMYFDHYQWPYYWMGGGLWGNVSQPASLNPKLNQTEEEDEEPVSPEDRETVLRSGHELTRYRLISNDKVMGYVEDLQLDTETWRLTHFQFDTRKWFHGKTLRLSPENVTRISWREQAIYADISE